MGFAQLDRPGLQGSLTRNLVVFDGLGCGEEASVDRRRALELLEDLLPLLDNTVDRRAGLATCRLAKEFEHLDQSLHLTFGFLQMFVECGLQGLGLGAVDHLLQGRSDFAFGVVDVLNAIGEQVFQCVS